MTFKRTIFVSLGLAGLMGSDLCMAAVQKRTVVFGFAELSQIKNPMQVSILKNTDSKPVEATDTVMPDKGWTVDLVKGKQIGPDVIIYVTDVRTGATSPRYTLKLPAAKLKETVIVIHAHYKKPKKQEEEIIRLHSPKECLNCLRLEE
jgi:hypothetical protein